MERNIEVPIIMVVSGKRPNLEKQATETIIENTEYYCRLIKGECSTHPDDIKVRNHLASIIDFDYEYICFVDDDLYFNDNWLEKMVELLKDNPDVYILSAIKWPAHKVLEKRKGINITDRMTGGCLLMKKEVWQEFGEFDVHRDKTNMFRERVQKAGGKVAVLNDEEIVIHCGIESIINNKGRSDETAKRIKKLADKVGAICE